jgi:hypothetical protein
MLSMASGDYSAIRSPIFRSANNPNYTTEAVTPEDTVAIVADHDLI